MNALPIATMSFSPRPTTAATAAARRERFARLAKAAEAALMRVALRLCRGGHDCAQELVQDALVRAYDAFRQGQFKEGTNAQAWLTRILTNNFINGYRRTKRWEAGVTVDTLTSGGAAGPPSTHAPKPDEPGAALMEETLDEPLQKALDALPLPLRETVLLVDVTGLSYDEAAHSLQIPVGTVRSRLSRARYQLHALLHDYAKERNFV